MTDRNYYLKAVNTGEFDIAKRGNLWRLEPRSSQDPEDYSCVYAITSSTESDIIQIPGIKFPGYTPLSELDRRKVSDLQEILEDVTKGSERSWRRLIGGRLFLSDNKGILVTPKVVSVDEHCNLGIRLSQ